MLYNCAQKCTIMPYSKSAKKYLLGHSPAETKWLGLAECIYSWLGLHLTGLKKALNSSWIPVWPTPATRASSSPKFYTDCPNSILFLIELARKPRIGSPTSAISSSFPWLKCETVQKCLYQKNPIYVELETVFCTEQSHFVQFVGRLKIVWVSFSWIFPLAGKKNTRNQSCFCTKYVDWNNFRQCRNLVVRGRYFAQLWNWRTWLLYTMINNSAMCKILSLPTTVRHGRTNRWGIFHWDTQLKLLTFTLGKKLSLHGLNIVNL